MARAPRRSPALPAPAAAANSDPGTRRSRRPRIHSAAGALGGLGGARSPPCSEGPELLVSLERPQAALDGRPHPVLRPHQLLAPREHLVRDPPRDDHDAVEI